MLNVFSLEFCVQILIKIDVVFSKNYADLGLHLKLMLNDFRLKQQNMIANETLTGMHLNCSFRMPFKWDNKKAVQFIH